MSSPDIIGSSVRSARKPSGVCSLCGESRKAVLHARNGHHVAGRVNDTLSAPICLNCHAVAHADMRNEGVTGTAPTTDIDRLISLLSSVGWLLVRIGERLIEWSRWLLALFEAMSGNPEFHELYVSSLPSFRVGVESV